MSYANLVRRLEEIKLGTRQTSAPISINEVGYIDNQLGEIGRLAKESSNNDIIYAINSLEGGILKLARKGYVTEANRLSRDYQDIEQTHKVMEILGLAA